MNCRLMPCQFCSPPGTDRLEAFQRFLEIQRSDGPLPLKRVKDRRARNRIAFGIQFRAHRVSEILQQFGKVVAGNLVVVFHA